MENGNSFLILGRYPRQTIKIGEDVEVTILNITNGLVQVGISAPKTTRIVRKELPKKESVVANNKNEFD